MKKAGQLALALFALVVSARAQQIAVIDLSNSPELLQAQQSVQKSPLPESCKTSSSGAGHGYARLPNGTNISVEVVDVNNRMPSVGKEVEAKVRLRNSGTEPIHVPWDPDRNKVVDVQDPTDRRYEFGHFTAVLKSAKVTYLLASLSPALYSSELLPESQIAVAPREWVSALVKFKIQDNIQPHLVAPGDYELTVRWDQTRMTEFVDGPGCSVGAGVLFYNYEQENAPILIQVRE